ncbi:HNH endonuclease signature motif containing protein, partial [Klebsiella pneumoniae]|uniref:HNH endonuclease signature motif containing protein n=1 Tax=Klebsiella pneumoniae TaxID=573 RepID=UPI003B27BDED
MHYGEWPVGDVDHINMDKTDNRISNLRLARRRDNMNNLTATKSNKSGFIGVYWAKA